MHRLFVAIRPPHAVREQLLTLMQGVRGARWQSDEQLHLTLSFIGEVDRHLAEDVAAGLGSVHHRAFTIALNEVGYFEKRNSGTLWAGVAPHDELRSLHKKVDQACRKVGAVPDNRAYLPHITLARLGRETGPIDAFVRESGGLASKPFMVDSFCLFESDLTPDGPIYSVIARYPLDSASGS